MSYVEGREYGSHLDRWGLSPEILLPEQWVGAKSTDASRHPEKSLMLAVLEEALATLGTNAGKRTRSAERLLNDVEEWYASDDVSWPFSFLNICHHLGFDPSCLRAGLVRWRTNQPPQKDSGSRRLQLNRRRATGIRTKVSGRAA